MSTNRQIFADELTLIVFFIGFVLIKDHLPRHFLNQIKNRFKISAAHFF
jgi:hypothetical protein